MVTIHSVRNVNNKIMHIGVFSALFFLFRDVADGIKGSFAFADIPFVFFQPLVVVWVNDGDLALFHRYAAKGIAVAEPPIQ